MQSVMNGMILHLNLKFLANNYEEILKPMTLKLKFKQQSYNLEIIVNTQNSPHKNKID